MKSVIVPAPGKIEIREVETPVINAYQALVKTENGGTVQMRPTAKLIAGHFPGSRYLSSGFGTRECRNCSGCRREGTQL